MKKKIRKEIMRNLHKNTTPEQHGKLALAYVNKTIDPTNSDSCILRHLFSCHPSYKVCQDAIRSDINKEGFDGTFYSKIEEFWYNNSKKAMKDVKYFLSLSK